MLITLTSRQTGSADVVVDADPATPVRDIVKNLLDSLDPSYIAHGHTLGGGQVYLDDRPLDLGLPLAASGVHDGAVLWVGEPGPAPYTTGGLITVRAVSGTGAGRIWSLGPGEHRIGSAPGCTVRLAEDVAPVAGVVRVTFDAQVHVRGVDGSLLLDREELGAEEVRWTETAQLTAQGTALEAHPVRCPDAVVEPSPESEYLDYNRPPRLLPPVRPDKFRIPAEPKPPTPNALPWLAAALPAIFGGVMALVLKNPMYLMFAAMSPLMVLGNWWTGRRQGNRSHRSQIAEHQERVAAIEADIAETIVLERHDRRVAAPDPAELLIVATGPRARLWERRRTDPDHLVVRVGIADLPSMITVEAAGQDRRTEPRQLHDVPVSFSIVRAGVVGVAGRGEWPRRLARWMTGQLAVAQSPRDLQLYVLTDPGGGELWEWAAWLPHTRPSLGQQTLTLLGMDAETIARRIAELLELTEARRAGPAECRRGRGDG